MLVLLISALFFAMTVRFSGANGRDRFHQLSEKRAQGIHDHFASSAPEWLIVFNMAAAAVGAALSVHVGSWLGATVALVAVGLLMITRAARPKARGNVNQAFAERGLEPLVRRETSERRQRRQKQFGTLALVGYLLGQVAQVLGTETGERWPQVLALPATLLMFGGGLALLWSTAWRYGDEKPA